jgi:uncharacterized membrane protein YidH (DUF202 family)
VAAAIATPSEGDHAVQADTTDPAHVPAATAALLAWDREAAALAAAAVVVAAVAVAEDADNPALKK